MAIICVTTISTAGVQNAQLTWQEARAQCRLQNERLATPDANQINDIANQLPFSGSAWVGARVVPEVWTWEDNNEVPVFQFHGCFPDTAVTNVTDTYDDFSVLQCFQTCRKDFVALKEGLCQCLDVEPNSSDNITTTLCSHLCPL